MTYKASDPDYQAMLAEQRDATDQGVLECIDGGMCRAMAIQARLEVPDARVIDRSLQRLRKAGKIAFTSGLGWRRDGPKKRVR